MKAFPSPAPLVALKRRWWAVVVFFGAAAGGTYLLFAEVWHPARAARWAVAALAPLIYLLGYTRLHLPLNRRGADGGVLPRFGPGSALTLLRGLLYGILAGFVVLPAPSAGAWAFVPGALYTVAALTDLLDGRLARRRNETTRLGAKLDVEVDSMGVLVASLLAVKFGRLPAIFVAMGGLYYAYRLLLGWHRRRGRRVYPLPEDAWRSRIGGFQVGFLCVILWPVFSPPLTTLAGIVLVVPVVASFVRDALVATGRLDPEAPAYRHAKKRMRRWLLVRAPVALRLVAGLTGGLWVLAAPAWEGVSPPLLRVVLRAGMGVGVVGVLAGVGGRGAALVLLAAGAFSTLALEEGAPPVVQGLTVAALMLLMTGLGPPRRRCARTGLRREES